MRNILASPAVIPKLRIGKYSRWAEHMDSGTLDAAIWAVGEFGSRYWAMKSPDGRFPAPVFERSLVAELRMTYALECFAIVRGTGRYDWDMPPVGTAISRKLRPRFRASAVTIFLVTVARRGLATSTSEASR